MSFNPQASPFSSSPISDRNHGYCASQRCTPHGGYMGPQQAKWQVQTSPSSSNRRNVCDPLAEGRRVRVDNVFYATRFVPDFIGAIGIPKSDIERIHSTGTSGGPGMCWVDFVSHAAALRGVEMLRAELRKWLPQVFLCSPATDLSGRTTSTGWRSSDDDHTLAEDFIVDQEWPTNDLGYTSPANVGSHPWLPSPKEDPPSIKNSSFLDNTSTSSLGHVAGNCSTRPASDRASVATENTFNSSAVFTSAGLDKDATAQSKYKDMDALGSDFVGTRARANSCLQNGDPRDDEPKEIKPHEIKRWTQSIVTTRLPTEPTPKQSATHANVKTPKPTMWATVASPCSRRPRSTPNQEATEVPAKVSGVIKGAAAPKIPVPSWADITKKTPPSTAKAVSAPVADKKPPDRPSPKKEEKSSSVSVKKQLLPSPMPTSHRTILFTGLEPTEDQEHHREEILKIFAGFKVRGISNRKKIDRTSNHASCFIDMETADDAQRALDTWPWPTDITSGGHVHIAQAKSESNRPLDYTVVKGPGERQSRRRRRGSRAHFVGESGRSHCSEFLELIIDLSISLPRLWAFTTSLNKIYEPSRNFIHLVFFRPQPQCFLDFLECFSVESLLHPYRSEPSRHADDAVHLAEYYAPVLAACALEGVV
ncbi:hypothetical protein PpBr36_05001 [Pyricularia pennisetigena]|uniref:hypothetical protein n=1 Tax=Pyricularia pennisetigena TaxID=1578925 RepID=UPI00114DB01D|nr:hypothetical protein PpBr36_05001 [Pyricularia pennisetigena]TLS26146.1 hypothetical protein PpBr36_05001 [Pyricularia pennisetigena]